MNKKKSINIFEIWKRYKTIHRISDRDKLLEYYVPLVKSVAGRMKIGLPKYMEFDELVSSGFVGLVDAVEKFSLEKEVKFETYATTRIRGSIIDSLRVQDWVPRSIRKKARDMAKTVKQLQAELGRTPSDFDICQKLDISISELNSIYSEISGTSLLSLEQIVIEDDDGFTLLKDVIEDDKQNDPLKVNIKYDIREIIANLIDELKDKEKLVLTLYYYEELTLKEIGQILDVTESRICQIHSKVITLLRGKILKKLED